MSNADLIAEARAMIAYDDATLSGQTWWEGKAPSPIARLRDNRAALVDALEAAEKRATEAEAEVVRLRSQRASHG